MTAYYNEIDPYAAQWLRNLIADNLIAPGDVDERDIRDIKPSELIGYTQCHFFAGIGGWSHALRLAGWPDDKPVWTGSCPCQPFSAAGRGAGVDDERHLWPAWFHLIRECRPGVIFGEQVEAAIKHGWLDLVQADLEGIGYAVAASGIPAAGIGAPHIRQRLWFVADADTERREWGPRTSGPIPEDAGQRGEGLCDAQRSGGAGGLADADLERRPQHAQLRQEQSDHLEIAGCGESGGSCPTNVLWRDADWLLCRDGKWRPVEPGTFPLAHGVPNRVGRLRAYGNAIVPQVAAEFIAAYQEGVTHAATL